MSSPWLYLTSRLALYFGLLGLGAALGLAVGLNQLQHACIAAGVMPSPGTPMSVARGMLATNPCWDSALLLQHLSNRIGIGAGILLILGGVLDRFGDRVAEAISRE